MKTQYSRYRGRKGRNILPILASLVVSACTSTPLLHNESQFQAISQVKKTSEQVDYGKVVQQEREVQTKLLEQELRVITDFTTAQRNTALLNMMTVSENLSENLKDRISERLKKVVESDFPILKDISTDDLAVDGGKGCGDKSMLLIPTIPPKTPAAAKPAWLSSWVLGLTKVGLGKCTQRLTIAQDDFRDELGFGAANCPADGNIAALDAKSTAKLLKKYRKAHPTTRLSDVDIQGRITQQHLRVTEVCRHVRSVEATVRVLIVGCKGIACNPKAKPSAEISGLVQSLLANTYRSLDTARNALARDKSAAEDAETMYKKAKDDYKAAAKQHRDAPTDKTREELEKLGDDIKEKIETATSAGGAFGVNLISKEKISEIDLLLSAAATGELDGERLKEHPQLATAARVSAALPGFVDQAKHIARLEKVPPLSGLVLEKARLFALKENAERTVSRREHELALMQRKAVALQNEVELLYEAWQLVDEATGSGKVDFTVENLLNRKADTSMQGRQTMMVRAIEQYLLSFTGPRREERAIEYRLIALTHVGALDSSETSLKIWEATIETPINSLSAYHGSGLTPGDLMQLLQAIGLGGIAVGVN